MLSLKKFDNKLKQYKANYRIVPTVHLNELQEEIEDLNQRGKINPEIYNSNLTPFQYKLPESYYNTRSIIIFAVPQRISIVIFKSDGKRIKAVIPPTYLFSKVRKECSDLLSEVFGKNIEIKRALLPLKLLATRSGLGRYGRNHLCYIDGMGSFGMLAIFRRKYTSIRAHPTKPVDDGPGRRKIIAKIVEFRKKGRPEMLH